MLSCQNTLQKKQNPESTPLKKETNVEKKTMEQTELSKTYAIKSVEVRGKKTLPFPIAQHYKIVVPNFPSNDTYKVHWYTQDEGADEAKFAKTGEEFKYIQGDANPGPNAIYATVAVFAEVEFSDNSKSERIRVFSYKYVKQTGFSEELKLPLKNK